MNFEQVLFTLIICEPFSAWCPLKGYTYLNKPAVSAAGLLKYVWPFSGHQTLKG